jgi:hypothetical protein
VIGLCNTVIDFEPLAEWLDVAPEGTFAFSTTNRATPVVTTARAFNIPHSATLMKSMVKPVYAAAKQGVDRQTIVFVPSFGQCRTVAKDLITQSGTEMDLNGFLRAPQEDVAPLLQRLRDDSLRDGILHGIGVFYNGMSPGDAAIVLELFASGIVPVLLASRETCWTLPVQAGTVVVMGAQYLEIPTAGHTDPSRPMERKLKNYSLQELVKMQGFAAMPPPTAAQALKNGNTSGQFYLMCQDEQVDAYLYFLNQGLPLESRLPDGLARPTRSPTFGSLVELLGPEPRREDLVDILSWSFLWLRMQSNPTYYDSRPEEQTVTLSRLVDAFFTKLYEKKDKASAPKPEQAGAAAVTEIKQSGETATANGGTVATGTLVSRQPAKIDAARGPAPSNGRASPSRAPRPPRSKQEYKPKPPKLDSKLAMADYKLHSLTSADPSPSTSSTSLHSIVNGQSGDEALRVPSQGEAEDWGGGPANSHDATSRLRGRGKPVGRIGAGGKSTSSEASHSHRKAAAKEKVCKTINSMEMRPRPDSW